MSVNLEEFVAQQKAAAAQGGASAPGRIDLEAFVAKKKQELEEKKYDNPLLAGALGFADTASFGLSRQFLDKTDLLPGEDQAKYAEYNPTSTTVGQVGGVVLPLAASGGTSLLAQGTAKLGSGVIAASKLGSAAEKIVARKLLGESVEAGAKLTAKQIAAKYAATGAGAAAENALYGAGHLISEEALGNADINAESIATYVGGTALLGGVLSLGVKGLSDVGPSILQKADILTDKIRNLSSDTPIAQSISEKVAKVSSKISGVEEETTKKLLNVSAEGREARKIALMSEKEREAIMSDSIDVFQQHYDQFGQIRKELSTAVRDTETKALLTEIDPVSLPDVKERALEIANQSQRDVNEMIRDRKVYSGGARISKVNDAVKEYKAALKNAEDPNEVFQAGNRFKREVDKWSKHDDIVSIELEPTVNRLKEIGSRTRSHLEDVEVYGSAGAAQAQYNRIASEYFDVVENFEKTFMKKMPDGSMKFDPVKFNTFLNQSGLERNKLRQEVLDAYINQSKKLLNELEVIGEGVPSAQRLIDQSPALSTAKNLTTDFEGQVGKQLNQAELRQDYKALRRGTEQIFTAGDFILPAAGYAAGEAFGDNGGLGLGIATSIRLLKNPAGLVEGLSALERIFKKTDSGLQSRIGSFFDRASGVVRKGKDLDRAIVPASLTALRDVTFASKDKKSEEAGLNKRLTQIAEWGSDPLALAEKLQKDIEPLSRIAPKHAEELMLKTSEIAKFLTSKVPKNPTPPSIFQPSEDKNWKPSDFEKAQFERYVAAVDNPMSVFDDLAEGRLSVEGVEVLKTIYPKMYAKAQSEILDRIAKKPQDLPYQTRLQLSQLFDLAIAPEMKPKSFQKFQQSFSPENLEGEKKANLRASGLQNLDMAGAAATDAQARELRQ